MSPYRFVLLAACLLTACRAHTRRATSTGDVQPPATRAANIHGKIPILEYHLIGDHESMYSITREHFRRDLEMLYARGYRPITVAQLLDKHIDVPAGMSPVVFTFDDASPEQFRYIERPDGTLEIDSTSGLGIWLDFHRQHPDWANHATFCLLPGAAAGHNFFGNGGIEGQKTAWRYKKVRYLAEQGFELCDHTLWHAQLNKYSDAFVQEQIARGQLAIDSAVPGYHVRTFALPQGLWPKNHDLAHKGEWRDPKTGHDVPYSFECGPGSRRTAGAQPVRPVLQRLAPAAYPGFRQCGGARPRQLGSDGHPIRLGRKCDGVALAARDV